MNRIHATPARGRRANSSDCHQRRTADEGLSLYGKQRALTPTFALASASLRFLAVTFQFRVRLIEVRLLERQDVSRPPRVKRTGVLAAALGWRVPVRTLTSHLRSQR